MEEEKESSFMGVVNKLREPKYLIPLEVIAGTASLASGFVAPNEGMAIQGYLFSGLLYLSAGLTYYHYKKDKNNKNNSKKRD